MIEHKKNNSVAEKRALLQVSSRGQVALEFIFMVIAGVALAVFLLAVVARLFVTVLDEKSSDELYDVAQSIQREVFLAAEAGNGYHRIINIPMSLRARSYSISSDNQTLQLTSGSSVVVMNIPPLNGSLVLGRNVISNDMGVLKVVQ